MDRKWIPNGEEVYPRIDRKWSQMNMEWIPEGEEVGPGWTLNRKWVTHDKKWIPG